MIIITNAIIIYIDVLKKQNFIVSVHASARWVKLAQSAEPILMTPTLLMGTLPGDASRAS